MSAKTPKLIPGQNSLFSGDLESSQNSMSWKEREENPMQAAYNDALLEGRPMVDLLDRAHRIIEALTEMGRISSVGTGFLTAVHTPHVERIDKQYGRFITPTVAENAKRKLPRREQRVKDLLGPATGYAALRATPELMPLEEVDARALHDWERFQSRFTGPDNQARREEYRRMLRKQVTRQKKLRKKHGVPIPE